MATISSPFSQLAVSLGFNISFIELKTTSYTASPNSDGVTTETEGLEEDNLPRKKFNPKKLDFIDERNEINPVQTDTTDSSYFFNNEDAISFNLGNNKK